MPVKINGNEHDLAVLVLKVHIGLEALFDRALDLSDEYVLVDALFLRVFGERSEEVHHLVLGLYLFLSHFPLYLRNNFHSPPWRRSLSSKSS